MRRNSAVVRILLPDPKFKSVDVSKLINFVMERGKKAVAESLVYRAFGLITEKTKKDPLEVFLKAIQNLRPAVEVKSRRVGGANFQVPIEVRSSRSLTLAMRWLVEYAGKRSEKGMEYRLAGEIMDAAESRGAAFKKKEDVHKMADANKAFSHFKFSNDRERKPAE